jgi:hypothetical protein
VGQLFGRRVQGAAIGGATTARREIVKYVVAVLGWAALGIWYKPILSMVVSPVWMVLVVSIVPRQWSRLRGRAR